MSCGHKVRSGYTGGLEWRSVAQPYLGTAVSLASFSHLFDSSLVRCLTLASAVRFKCSQWLIFALPLFGLNRIPFLSALQSAQCECVFTQTAQVLFLSFTLPFGKGFAFRANTKVSWFLIVHGAMPTLLLVLILLVFAVTCESH